MLSDNLLSLPHDILVHILKKLQAPDLRNAMLTCKTLRCIIMNDNTIWRSFSHVTVVLQDVEGNRWFNNLSWYDRYRLSRNWRYGCYQRKELVHHYVNYMPWLNFYNSEVLLLTIGSELICYKTDNKGLPLCPKNLWKIDVPKVTRQDVRTNDISRFVLKDDLLVCGNRDGCVAVYSGTDIRKKPKLQCLIRDCHEEGSVEVTAVEVISERGQMSIMTGSSGSSKLAIYKLKGPDNRQSDFYKNIELTDCSGAKCLAINKISDRLAVGLKGNSEPLLLDVEFGKILKRAESTANHRQSVRDIQWHNNNTVVYCTHAGFLQFLDARTNQVVFKARDPFQSTIYCIKTDGENGIIFGSAEYSRCVLFDARNHKNHVQMYFTQRKSSPVYSLAFDSTKLITAVDRGVGVLNFDVNNKYYERKDYSHQVFS